MAEKTLATFRTNFERLEHSRDLGLVDSFASGTSGSAGKYLENGAVLTPAGTEETRRLLGSKSERERTEGLKRVVAMMTRSLPVSSFFPLVTSLLGPATSLQSRTLISLYIVHCASTSPELALLSINAYQKDLSDPNPLVRAGAIATLSRMNLPDIRELVGLALQKGARDTSWYVRRASADAIRTLYLADPAADNRASLLPTLQVLLDNASPLTVGAALAAWEEVALQGEKGWEMLHRQYRRFCKMLVDVEEWGQVVLVRVLLRYGRTFFLDPARTGKVDPDAELAIKSSEPLLQHLNPAVVSATITLHYYLSPPSSHSRLIRPLLRLLHSPPEVASAVLAQCVLIAEERPELFAGHLSAFYVRFGESGEARRLRLRVLTAAVEEKTAKAVLKELVNYVNDMDESFSRDAISAIGSCAQKVPSVAGECLTVLINLLGSVHESTIATTILTLRTLLTLPTFPSSGKTSRTAVITRLAALLHAPTPRRIQSAEARATVYWLVGQYAEGLMDGCAPDLVRLGAREFKEEPSQAKLHLLVLSAKLLVLSHLSPLTPHLRPLSLLFTYLTTLARYDLSYPVRDRARFLAGLVASGGIGRQGEEGREARVMLSEEDFRKGVQVESLTGGGEEKEKVQRMTAEMVRKVLFEGKQQGAREDRSTRSTQLGTLSLTLPGARLPSSAPHIPPYPSSVPPSSIRDPPPSASFSSAPNSRSSTPLAALQGFGSDSFQPSSPAAGERRSRDNVVLVPSSHSAPNGSIVQQQPPRRRIGMDEFLASEEESSEYDEQEETEEEEDESNEEEEGDESSQEEEQDGEESGGGSEEDESEGGTSSGEEEGDAPRTTQ
ncbi:AP-3 complex subunit beta [Rhodosporidiobolus nylandii]